MFTHGIKGNILFQNHFIILYMKLFLKMFIRFIIKSAINFLAHAGDTFRSSLQSLSVYILADSLEKKLDRLFNFCFVYHK